MIKFLIPEINVLKLLEELDSKSKFIFEGAIARQNRIFYHKCYW